MKWHIEPIALHRVRVPGPEVLFQRGFTEMVDLVIYAFVLRGGALTCVVDTGLAADYTRLNDDVRARKGPASGFVDIGLPLPQQLSSRGLRPDHLLLTSFGPYTTGALDAWPDMPLWVSARGCDDLLQPEEAALTHPVEPALRERLLGAHCVSGEREVLPGLTLVETGIHHPASAAVLVDTEEGTVGILDPVFLARNLREGIALGAAEHAAGWHAMVRRIGRRSSALLPIHDPEPTPLPQAQWHTTLRDT